MSVWGFEASLSLLFNCLSWIISPLFNCKSRLVLGRVYFGFHSLLCHLTLLSVGVSFVGGFSLPAGILVSTSSSYSFCDQLEW